MTMYHGLSKLDLLLKECVSGHALADAEVLPQTFGYLFRANPITGNLSAETIVTGFDALVETMRVGPGQETDGPAEAGQTFVGQFIDHDVTFDATSSIGTRIDPRSIRNVRTPNLDLDCVYGDGPEATPFLYSPDHEGFLLMGRQDNPNDLPRNCKGRALIGDPRNDENILVSQIHGAFIQLHNILMTKAEENGGDAHDIAECAAMGVRKAVWDELVPAKLKSFEEVRRFVRLHYQWFILKDFLPAFVQPDCIAQAIAHDPFHDTGPIMPAEFSVAAYRFGHATVRPTYRLKPGGAEVRLFDMLGFQPRTPDADIAAEAFFDLHGPFQRALEVGPAMADVLLELPPNVVSGTLDFNGFTVSETQARKLGLRNILRDRTALELVSGQQAHRMLGLPGDPLPAPQALRDHHITKTPLWFYCLQEAREKGDGRLTGVGGLIVASVFVRLLKLDAESVLHVPGFQPWSGFSKPTFGGMMKFVEENRDQVAHREDLFC